MCSALCAENNLVFGNEERFCQFWNAMSRWICKRNIKQAALLISSAACIIKEESLSIVSGVFRSKLEHVDYGSSKSIHSTGCIRP